MPKREPKSRTVTTITAVGRSGGRLGMLEITSGNIFYYRSGAKGVSGSWSLQQLIDLLETDLVSHMLRDNPKKLPNNKHKDDFSIDVTDVEGSVVEEGHQVISAVYPLQSIRDDRKLEEGVFQIDFPSQKPSFGFIWTIRIGIHTAIYMLDLYVSKWLAKKRGDTSTNRDVPISRAQFRSILRQWLAKIDA